MREKIFTGLVSVLLISSCGGNGSGINPSFNPPVGEPSPIVRGIFDLQSSTCRTDGSQLSIVQNVRQVLMKGGFEYSQESFGGGYEVLGSIDHENVVKFTIEGESETLTCVATLLEPVFQGTCTLESGGTCDFVFSRASEKREGESINNDQGDAFEFEEVDSLEDFQDAIRAVGDAKGSQFSGQYQINHSGLTYSSDCKAAFVLATDFFVNTSLSVEEVEEIIRTGSEGGSGTLTVIQNDGSLTFVGVGDDDADVTGAVYSDGRFRIVYGVYENARLYQWSEYQGRFENDRFTATFRSRIKIENEEISGSCGVEGSVSGLKRAR